MFCWIRIDVDDVKRVCWQHWNVLYDWLQRGECLRGRDGATDRLHMQPRLRFNINNNDRLCGQHGHLRCLWGRL